MDFKVLRWPKCLKDIYFLRGLKEERGLDTTEYLRLVEKFDKLVENEPVLVDDDFGDDFEGIEPEYSEGFIEDFNYEDYSEQEY